MIMYTINGVYINIMATVYKLANFLFKNLQGMICLPTIFAATILIQLQQDLIKSRITPTGRLISLDFRDLYVNLLIKGVDDYQQSPRF
jgi:hypothetical protein